MECSCGFKCETDSALAAHLSQAGEGHAPVEKAPAEELALSATLERVAVPAVASQQHAVLSVVAPSVSAERAPVNLVAVLDRSGSMGGEKLRLVLETTRYMLQHLRAGDQLGLVSYDTHVRTDAPLTCCDEAGKLRLTQALSQIRAGSCTNLSGGLLEGLALHSGRRANEVTFGNTYTPPAGPGYPRQRMQNRCSVPPPPPPQQQNQMQMPMQQQCQMQQLNPAPEPPQQSNGDASQQSLSSSLLGRGMNMMQQLAGRSNTPNVPSVPAAGAGEWAVELRAPMGVVRSVKYTLPGTSEVVEVTTAPFNVARPADRNGPTTVRATVTLMSGTIVNLEHELRFQHGGSFRPIVLPGMSAPAPPASGVVRSTLLFTDGLANEGIKDTAGICAAARAALGESDTKSTIHTFGFGADHNAEMLRAIAQVGDGEYFFIESQDNVADSFGEAIGGLLSTTHQNIQLQVTLAPGVAMEPLTTFQHETEGPTPETGGPTTTITLGDLFAEERRDVLVRFSVPAGESAPLAAVRARAYSLAKQAFVDLGPVALEVSRSDVEEQGNPEVLKHVNRHVATVAMDAARQEAARGDLAAARVAMTAAEAQLAASPAALAGCTLTNGLLEDLRDAQTNMKRQDEYERMGSKKLALMSKMHGKQRACAYEGSAATEMYSGSAQRAMKSAFKSAIR